MDRDTAHSIIERHRENIKKGLTKCLVKKSHLEELSPLCEVNIEELTLTKKDFHPLSGNTFQPRKETLDTFADAAGISYNESIEQATRKEGEDTYVGKSQARIMGPDGKWRTGDICEYEFDVAIRYEEDILRDKSAQYKKYHDSRGALKETAARLHFLELRKAGRARANTGARSRATLNILGMQTGMKDLFGKNDPDTTERVFLFSRIMVNTKNELVLNRALDSMFGTSNMLFGPQTTPALSMIENPAETRAQAPPSGRDVTEPPKDQGLPSSFGKTQRTPSAVISEIDKLKNGIQDYLENYQFHPEVTTQINNQLKPSATKEMLITTIENIQTYLVSTGQLQAEEVG